MSFTVSPSLALSLLCRKLLKRVDRDGSRGMSLEEMVHWMVRMERADSQLGVRHHFIESDRNADGYVTLMEFARTAGTAGGKLCSQINDHLSACPIAW